MSLFLRLSDLFRRDRGMHSQVDAYLDGELSTAEATRFESHLESCERCRRTVHERRELMTVLTELPIVDSSRSLHLTPEMLAQAPIARHRPDTRAPVLLRAAQITAGLALFGLLGSITLDVRSTSPEVVTPPATAAADGGDTRALPTPGSIVPTSNNGQSSNSAEDVLRVFEIAFGSLTLVATGTAVAVSSKHRGTSR